jgi:hypothetical protein
MIFVSRIVGESYDLGSGKELPKALVLSNGKEELLLFVEDDIIQSIIRLSQTAAPAAPAAPVQKQVLKLQDQVQVSDESEVRLNPSLIPEPAELPEPPVEEGPGSDYDDPTTGVASL